MDPKLELTTTNKRVNRLKLVRMRADRVTKQRIQMQIDQKAEKEMEKQLMQETVSKKKGQ